MANNPPIPAIGNPEEDSATLGWCNEVIQEADAFNKSQIGYDKIDEAINAIMSKGDDSPLTRLSRARSNRIGKIASDLAALLTDTKVFWEYKTENQAYEKQMEILGKLSTQWYYNRQIDMRFSDLVRYWSVAGTSYAHLHYGELSKDIECSAEDPRDVLIFRPSGYESIQGSEGGGLRRERTVNYLRQRFPDKAHLIVADRDGAAAPNAGGATGRLYASLGMSPFDQRLWGDQPKRQMPKIPVCDFYTMYVNDERVNETSDDVLIGQFTKDGHPLNNWSYRVPPGEALYPRKRLIQFTKTAVLYNSTSIYWHGRYPFPKFTLDPWPWSWFGKAPLWDLLPLQTMYDKTFRAIEDLREKFVQPDLIADKNSVSRASLATMNTRAAGQKYIQNSMVGKGITLQYPQIQAFELCKVIVDIVREEMDTISGVRDMSQIMRLNQVPGADTLEKLTESMSPAVRGRSRGMEAFVREFARILSYNFAQFYTMPMRMKIGGPEALTKEDFDFDPGTFIPAFAPGDHDGNGLLTPEAIARGPLPRYARAREFMDQFSYHVAPGSLLKSSEIEERLMYLQLASRGLMDKQSLLEKLGVPNVPQILQRLADEQAQQMMMAAGAQAAASGQGGPPGAGGMEGRPPSWQATPKLVQKDGGLRSTVKTS